MAHFASPTDSCHRGPSIEVVGAPAAVRIEHTLQPTASGPSHTSAPLEAASGTSIFPSSTFGALPQPSAPGGASINIYFLTSTRNFKRIVRLAADFNIHETYLAVERAFDNELGDRRLRQLIFVPLESISKGPILVARNDQATWDHHLCSPAMCPA